MTDPWYTRTEFWFTLVAHLAGMFIGFNPHAAPLVQTVGTSLGLAAPMVYTFGRGNVKANLAAANMTAVAQALGQAAAGK